MPVASRRAMLEDIEKQKLSHNKKHSKISATTGRLIPDSKNANKNPVVLPKIDLDLESKTINVSEVGVKLTVTKIKPTQRSCDTHTFTYLDNGDIEMELNAKFDVIEGEEPEEGIEVEISNSMPADEDFDITLTEPSGPASTQEDLEYAQKKLLRAFKIPEELTGIDSRSGQAILDEDYDVLKVANELEESQYFRSTQKSQKEFKKELLTSLDDEAYEKVPVPSGEKIRTALKNAGDKYKANGVKPKPRPTPVKKRITKKKKTPTKKQTSKSTKTNTTNSRVVKKPS